MTCTIMNLHIFRLRLSQCLIRIFILRGPSPRLPGEASSGFRILFSEPAWAWVRGESQCLRLLHVARLKSQSQRKVASCEENNYV